MVVWGVALLALACGAARGDDYGGPPLYGGAALYAAGDYRAPGDYKYAEDSQGNTERSTEDTVEIDPWENAPRIRGQRREHFSEVESMPRAKSKARHGHPRSRARAERRRAREHPAQENHRAYRDRQLDEEFYTFNLRKTTDRIIRRKPRDKLFSDHVKPLKRHDLESEEELFMDRKLKSESMEREDAELEEEGDTARGAQARPSPPAHPAPPAEDDEELEQRARPALYRDDADYYDMRRLHDVSSELPMLLRRTTTRPPPARDGASSASTEDVLALLLTARRRASLRHDVYAPAPDPPHPATGPRPAHESSGPSNAPIIATLSTLTSPPTASTPGSTSELSIAEKSRLSILKKSQKKDSDKGEASRKPPVLLQVTSRLPTVVMVEPPTSGDPWLRARPVSGDSPQQLVKVKRLMRRKLVAGARSVQDLTDDWDRVLCDYIDVSLLAAAPPRHRHTPLFFICTALALLL